MVIRGTNEGGGTKAKGALRYVGPRRDEDRVQAKDELRNEQLPDTRQFSYTTIGFKQHISW
jgi:hypothetical protein